MKYISKFNNLIFSFFQANNYKRILNISYVPNWVDVMSVRVKTLGVTKQDFQVGNIIYTINDVGGQRSERKKWKNV